MFDLSFGKLAIIFALCLVVLGPEKLPKLAAQLGRWTGQARAMARHFREQLESEIATEQLLKEKREFEQSIASSMESVKNTTQSATAPLNEATEIVENTIHPPTSSQSTELSSAPESSSAITHTMLPDDFSIDPAVASVDHMPPVAGELPHDNADVTAKNS